MSAVRSLFMGVLAMAILQGCASTPMDHYRENSFASRLTETQNQWRFQGGVFYGDQLPQAKMTTEGRIQNILDRLVYVSPLRGHRVTVQVVTNPQINARTNGRTIYLNSGLVNALGQDESLLAAIMAHELGHIIASHIAHRGTNHSNTIHGVLQPALNMTRFGALAGLAVRESAHMHSKTHNRYDEKEADAVGAILAYEAGYDPYGLNRFFDHLTANPPQSNFNPKSLPIPNSANPSTAIQGTALFLLRASPLYKTHPPSRARKKTVDLVAKVKMGEMTLEELRKKNSWLADIYETFESRRPKSKPPIEG